MTYDTAFWQRYFRYYDTLNHMPPYEALHQRVVELLALRSGERLLDAGTGTGNLIARLSGSEARLVGLDINEVGLARAAGKASRAALLRGSLESPLPLADATFDAVASINVIYILSEAGRRRCLSELRRVLRPDGRLVLVVPVVGFGPLPIYAEAVRVWLAARGLAGAAYNVARFVYPSAAILLYNVRIARQGNTSHYRFFEEEDLRAYLSSAGFCVETIERTYGGQCLITRARLG